MTVLLTAAEASRTLTRRALASSESAAGGCDCDQAGIVQLDRLSFPSLDEPMLIQMRLEQRKRAQQRDRWIGRAIGAGVGLAVGINVEGFALGDLTTAFMGGVVGDLTADGLHSLSDRELEQLGLSWAVAPDTFLYHQRRHGRALHRVLLLALSPQGKLRTTCGVRFADGYLAFFSPDPYSCDLPLFQGARKLSGKGAMPEPGHSSQPVSCLRCSDGRERPLEALITDKGPLLAMTLPTPHHSLY